MTRLSALTAATSVADTDIFHLSNDPTGTNVDKKITGLNLLSSTALLAGRSGGQIIIGGTASGNGLTLTSSSHATKGIIGLDGTLYVDGVNLRVGIGTSTPAQKLHITNGNMRIDQVASAGALSAAAGGAGVLTGNYIYAVTFVTALGETSVTVANETSISGLSSNQVNLTNIPVSVDSSVTSRKIYRTAAGGAFNTLKLLTTIANNTATTFTDNVADGSLGANMPWKNTTGGNLYSGTGIIAYTDLTFTAFGIGIPQSAIGGYQCTAFGSNTLNQLTTGYQNAAFGYSAGQNITSGSGNMVLGYSAGNGLTTATSNTAIGASSMQYNQTGSSNTMIGNQAGFGVVSNSYANNTALGNTAGFALTTGGNNVLIGMQAGNNLTTGASNVILGYNIQTPAVGTNNFMSLGNLIFATGISGTGTTVSPSNLGIGIAAPTAKLHVSSASLVASASAWTTTGRIFATDALSLTNSTSSGTVALQVEHSFGVPTLLASSSTTITLSANVYVAGAPIASTNVTQTQPFAMMIDTGAAASKGLLIRGAASQSVNLLEIYDSGNARLLSVSQGGLLTVQFKDAVTNTVSTTTAFTHQTTGTAAANFGTALALQGQSSNTPGRNMARLRSYWSTATDASRATITILSSSDSAAERDAIGWGANGSAAILGFYPTVAAAPIAQPTTAGAAATFAANTSAIANDTATFDGYTIGQVVKALRNLGLLA